MDARKAHKASSSSSPSSSSKRWKYDVFLSFRGEDTRKGFTGHLHAALSDAGISAFLDDNELERAEFIKTQLEQAIDGSMISIIVFSKRYADSSWCLDELVKIMDCRERLEQQVIPLFYNVEASDVRKQTGSFEQAFEKHEAGKHEKEKVQRWRNALSQAADLCGEDLKNADNGHEAKFINKILGVVNKHLYSKYRLDIKHPVGITSRVKVLSNHLDIENSGSKDVVRMIGILGMGGIGKTTLAKTIYNKFEGNFQGRSFLANVREPINGLVGLQEQLLNDILKSEGIKVGSVAKGIDMIRARLCCKRALVIIDDADDLQQLKAIARARDWFGPGSRIVITTRNEHLLEQVGVDSVYMAQEMDENEALELFGWHAFESGYPNQEYLDLSKQVIRYCQGLPLALEVVGSFLIKRPIAEWESDLEKLERSPDGDIQKILRISYDGLPDPKNREIFLDISCFFIGMDKDYVTQILDGCDLFATIGISVLIERCLLTVSEQKKLMMHDLLQDMGREIVRENARGHPEKFSRLWKREDITNVLSDESGTEEIEGVALDLDLDLDLGLTRFSAQALTNMKKLRLLHLSNVELTGEYKDFPKKLTWLCWHGFPLESIPDEFPNQPKLVALDLQYSDLKIVWKDCKLHQKLKILNLSHSYQLKKSPDFSKLPNLEELILEDCFSLSEVHSSIGDLGRLSLVNLQGCIMLKDLPLNFYKSKSIETLLLNGCYWFENLAEGLGDMVSLTTLKADNTAIRQIPSSILKLKKLKALSLYNVNGSPSTYRLPPSLQSLSSLRELALEDCSLTGEAFPKDLGSLISLERLSLASNDFSSLASLSRLSELKYLSLYMCENLSAIPDLPTNLEVLQADGCIALEKMPDFSEMSNLRELSLGDSGKLTEIPGLNESLNSMTRIHMENCTNLTADFRKNILQGWTSCGFGGIFLSGNDIPDWFHYVHDDDIVYFTVPQSVGYNLKGLTLSFVYSSERFSLDSCIRICIKNMTKGTELDARITPVCPTKGYYLWQGQLSNNELKLLDGDKVLIEIIHEYDWAKVKVKKTGVRLVWDKFMNENMIDYHLCAYDRRPYLVNDDDIIHVEYDNHITKSPDFSQFPFLEKLILKGCEHLYKVHSSIGDLGRLSLVNLEGCNNLEDFPLNFYKSKSIKTLLLNRCSRFRNLADGLGDMVSLTILEANETRIRQIPSSIVKLKNLRILSLSGLRLTEDAIPKDLCSLISLERLLLGGNDFCSLPSLAGLSKLQVLCLNACGELLAIPDLPTNLHALKAIDCPALERIPDFSKMSNMRELYLSDSFKLTEVPGLDKSLNSMTRIHMEGCTNLILQHTSLQEQVMDTSTAIESSSPTSSSSSSVSLDDGTYDVFLSFRGEDTRKNFTDHLYWTLKDARVDVFIDENELRGGEIIPDELKQVIQRSRIAVVIFSRRYADSIKCLEELEKIMECRRTLGQIVLPIFYDVDPSDVRKQTGSFAKAFQTHEVCFHGVKDKEEKIQSWRKSLTEAASLEGRDFSNSYGYQGVFIRNIIDEIIQKLKSTCLDVATNQVGIESSKQEISNYVQVQVGIDSRVQEISTHLDVGGSNDVRIIGIWGMVGMGKTTVAEAIFNKYHPSFDAKSFLRSMRERKLVDLQEQLLFDIVKLTKVEGNNVGEMMDEIKRRLQRRKVLVILDDICHADQLKALAIERDSFGLGSRIVITTRSKHLLEIIEVDKICSLKEMNEVEALELLSWHAFKSRRPSEGYLELSREVVGYCGGLPLALKVLGSFLFKRSTTEWRNALDKWKTLPPKEIHEKLKLSYDELPDNYLRDTFLDISCFFIGMDMNYVMQILVRRGFSPVIGLSVLLEESLLTVGVDNKLMMHDLVRDMGREIVRAQSPNIPGERSRLWHHEDVKDVLRNKSGTEEIEALTLDFQESADPSFSTEAFRRMWRLRLLKLNYVQLTGSYKHFSKELRWLCWHGFPLEVIPKDFYQKNLVAIDMSYSKLIRVWEDSHLFLSELKSLVLSHSTCLKQLPDFSILPNLEELILRGCKSLLWDHDFMTQLDKLKLLDLGYCNLTEDEVLADLRRLRSLKILRLDGNGFKWLHFLRDLSELEELTLNDCKNLRRIRDLPVTLKFLKANYCTALETIEFFSHMSNVRELYLKDCSKLMYISDLDDSLHFMETIHMEGCTNLCAGLQKSVVEGWAASGGGGLFFSGSDIPSWFRAVVNGDEIVYIDVPNSGIGALTVCIIYSSDDSQSSGRLSLTFANRTQRTAFSIFPMTVSGVTPHEDYLWLGRIPNNVLNLKGGDKVHAQAEFLREEGKKHFKLKKTGVFLEEKEFVPEDCVYKMEWKSKPYTHPDTDDEAWPSKHSHNLVGEMRRLPPEFEDRLLQVPLWHGARKPRAPQGIGHKRKNI